MASVGDRASALLAAMLGPDAEFRPGQLEAIEAIVDDRRRVLLVQRTGWGKSAVYFIATRLLRDEGSGPTLLVSPLLALMRNQVDMASRLGLHAETINSSNRDEWSRIEEAIHGGHVDLLLISPERLNNEDFRRELLPRVAASTCLLVVDEAHCISDWGHDFRPDYRRLVRVLDLLPRGVPVLCTTATANDRVIDDTTHQLGDDLLTLRGTLDRESLVLEVVNLPDRSQRLAWLATVIAGLSGSGIVYCLTIPDTQRVAMWLRSQGIDARAYSGDTEPETRLDVEQALLDNQVKVVVATSALGMGFDKPDLGFVIHYQSPGSPIAYYQQVGRAGRAMETAHGVLMRGHEDADIQDFFIRTAFPTRPQAEAVVGLLQEQAGPMTLNQILAHVNVRRSRLEAMLKVLEVEGAVERDRGKWQRTLAPWAYDEERVERVTAVRRSEQDAMRRYAEGDACLMWFLRHELDDPGAARCGRCANCTGKRWDVPLDPAVVDAARRYLRSPDIPIEPRARWPAGVGERSGAIALDTRLQPGRALSYENDDGWGGLVRAGRYGTGSFADELVRASAELIAEQWRPDPFPEWLTCVPSRSHPDLVPSFAERLAAALRLPFLPVVGKVRDNRPQKEMENSAQQLRNVLRVFVVSGAVPAGPVLLVDDVVDSRWTLTVVGEALRLAGSGPVYPFVLAVAVGS
jgi:ATP-dependent DNA helicase RecQ